MLMFDAEGGGSSGGRSCWPVRLTEFERIRRLERIILTLELSAAVRSVSSHTSPLPARQASWHPTQISRLHISFSGRNLRVIGELKGEEINCDNFPVTNFPVHLMVQCLCSIPNRGEIEQKEKSDLKIFPNVLNDSRIEFTNKTRRKPLGLEDSFSC